MAQLETLTDDFTTPPLDPAKWTFIPSEIGTPTAVVSGGVLNLTVNSASSSSSGIVRSVATYGCVNTSVLAKVTTNSTAVAYQTALRLVAAGSNEYASILIYNGSIYFECRGPSGQVPVSVSTAYIAATHAWWRIRHSDTTIFFETAPDGVTWTIRAQGTHYPSVVKNLEFFAYSSNGAGPLATTFDSINLAPQKIETLSDDFLGAALDPAKWNSSANLGNVSVVGGLSCLQTTSSNVSATADFWTAGSDWRLNDSSIYVKANPSRDNTTNSEFRVENTTLARSAYFRYRAVNNTILVFAQNDAGTAVVNSSVAYDPVNWAYWRFRHSGTILYFDRSPDGVTWTQHTSASSVSTWTGSVRAWFKLNSTTATDNIPPHLYTIDAVNMIGTGVTGFAPAGIAETETLDGPAAVENSISELADEFLGSTLDPAKWSSSATQGTVTVSDGFARLQTTGTATTATADVWTVDTDWRLNAGSGIYVKANPSRDTNTYSEFRIENTPLGRWAYFRVQAQGTSVALLARSDAGTTAVNTTLAYDSVGWAYLRFRQSGTVLYFERSPDGITWTQVASSGNTSTWTDSVRVYFKLTNVSTSNTPPHLFTLDAVNMLGGAAGIEPTGIADPETLDGPTLGTPYAATATPDPLGDPEALGTPAAAFQANASTPDSLADPETLDGPQVGLTFPVHPDSLADPETLDGPDMLLAGIAPDEVADPDELGLPDLSPTIAVDPDAIADPETLADVDAAFAPETPYPDTVTDPETLAAPGIVFYPGVVNPDGITDTGSLGTPAPSFIPAYNGGYSTGDYGVGPYSGLFFSPTGIADEQLLGYPQIFSLPPVDKDTVLPLSIIDGETLDEPTLPRPDATNYEYGAGTYTEGPYYGTPSTPTDTNPTDNITYSTGTYGYGIYYGESVPLPPSDLRPLFTDIAGRIVPPLHILGIGPWSPLIEWRGAPNYGLRSGRRPSRPAMALPPATGKGFTLRLNDGGEARLDLSFPRGSAVILDEMDTDLWWRRKDPRTEQLEMIGRFNVAHMSVATSDTGVTCNAQLVDYRTLLADRMVLRYLHPYWDPPMSQWQEGTPVMEILDFALPRNTGLDMSAVRGPNAYDLGKITGVFELPPGSLISDVMDNLNAMSPNEWEWWVDTPLSISELPRLEFIIGERGLDKGVVLFDKGFGPSPIASWTRTGASDDYANSIYYTGGDGGVVESLDAQIRQYGQRDVQDGNSSLGGDIGLIRRRAQRKLAKLADRRPSYTVSLKQGFWRGRHHIDVGDTVRLILRLGQELLNDKYRVSEISVNVDENNLEEVTLTLGRLPVSADPRSKRAPLARVLRYLKNYAPSPNKNDVPTPDDEEGPPAWS